MNVLHLLAREITHRRLNFLLGLVAVAGASALVVGGITLLAAFVRQSEALVTERRGVVEARNHELNDAMRVITKRMGFNVVIMPRGQNLDDPFADDFAARTMPEEYADRLASSDIVTVNHLLPVLEQRVEWPERNGRTFFLTGIKGQVPFAHRDPKKPIMQPVPKDGIVVGSSLARSEKIAEGEEVVLLGERYRVVRVNERRGDRRDMTAWIDLARMQRAFQKEGRINAIWALECSCALADVGKVREELTRILPDVEIEEQGEKALARAEARKKALDVAEAALAAEESDRQRLAQMEERFRWIFVPLIIVSAGVWLALLAVSNVRERRYEIGLLRALGVRSSPIASLFLLRAALTGLVGAVPGYALGVLCGAAAWSVSAAAGSGLSLDGVVDERLLLCVVVCAPLLSALACWLPALAATRQDPGIVLRAEAD